MRVHVVGLGRYGSQLALRLVGRGLASVGSRNPERHAALQALLPENVAVNSPLLSGTSLGSEDVIVLCIPDDALQEWCTAFAKQLGRRAELPLVVISSGGTGLAGLQSCYSRVACCWPVMSFSHSVSPDWSTLPLVLQVFGSADAGELMLLSSAISGLPPKLVDSDQQRQMLHLSAVLVQNFTNHLWANAADLTAAANVDWKLLLPLAQGHLQALGDTAHPKRLQTGPAARGDQQTQAQHKALLQGRSHGDLLELYVQLSAAIARRTQQTNND